MTTPVRINKQVVLQSSDNQYIQYPAHGVIEDVEYAVDGSIIWGTFRLNGTSCPVVVREILAN